MIQLSRADLEGIHRDSSRHRAAIEGSQRCGCFYCLATFPPAEIADWIDPEGETPPGVDDLDVGKTALCPRCGIDAVLPDAIPGVSLDENVLQQMQTYWFQS